MAHLDYTYRYAEPSSLDFSSGAYIKLATCSPGAIPNPYFFEGALHQPQLAAQLLGAVHLIVGSRFFTPANSVAAAIALADPVVTSGGGMLRFEGFSGCCSTYIRVDLEPQAYAGDVVGKGTTNIDFNAPMRAALAKVRDDDGLALSVGGSEFAIRTAGGSVVERKVELPLRWVRSMVAVQSYQASMRKVFEVGAIAALRFLRGLPKASTSKTPLWVVAGPQGMRTTAQNDGAGVRFTDATRLRVLESLLPKAKSLTLYTDPRYQASAWCLDFGNMRLTLVLSAEVWRGFSGEGQALQAMMLADERYPIAAVRAQLNWQSALRTDVLADQLGWPRDQVDLALQVLGASGVAGFDLAQDAYFHRVLPFDLSMLEEMYPRLADARALLLAGAVQVLSAAPLEALVKSADVSYRVRELDGQLRCTCPWFAKHQVERGPCKHMLAAEAALNLNSWKTRANAGIRSPTPVRRALGKQYPGR